MLSKLTGAARRVVSAGLLAGFLLWPVAATAQVQAPTSQDEQTDVWEWLKHRFKKETAEAKPDTETERRRMHVLYVPILGSKPSTGFVFGAGASLEFPLGDLPDTYVSSILTGASFSTKKQFSISARLSLFGPGNRWALSGDNHFQKTGQETYGFGTDSVSGDAVNAKFNSTKFVETYLRALRHDVYAGVGFQFQRQSNIGPRDEADAAWASSPFVAYSQQFGFDLSAQTSAGVAVSLRHDNRDNVSDPSTGWYADATYRTHFADFLGGDSTWQRLLRRRPRLQGPRRRSPSQGGVLGLRGSRDRRPGAVLRPAGDGHRPSEPFGPRLRRRPVPGRPPGVR